MENFLPEDFITFSKNILNCKEICQNEALFRSAVSRAYYSAFLTARNKIDKKYPHGIDRSRQDIHQQVIEILKVFRGRDEDLSHNLFELKQHRVDADYHFLNAESENEKFLLTGCDYSKKQTAEDCVGLASDIICRIEKL